ncbi:MAG: proline--tRNA ligase [Nakamurella sp.]
MITRFSQLFVKTLREAPSDAELPGHRMLVRAGYVRRAAPGIHSWLPLGWRVLKRIEQIVREEMTAIGGQEVHFPGLLPREPYEATGRWTEYGDNLFRLKDRRGIDHLLGPTHEEMFTLLVKDQVSSYKALPLTLFQIQTKYRDEARPRAGLLRGREFVMKDSYTFDIDDEGLEAAYQRHRAAYIAIFDRLGLDYVIVRATSGAMGGSASEEFLAVSEHGEDTFVRADAADGSITYAANVEAVRIPTPAPVDMSDLPAAQRIPTSNTPTIATLVAELDRAQPRTDGRAWAASDTLKNVLVTLIDPDGSRRPLAIGVPGDREVDLKRLAAEVEPAVVAPFTDEDFAARPVLAKGYLGPGVLGLESESKIEYRLDALVGPGSSWVTGADADGEHVMHLVNGRDFTADGVIHVAEVRDGDPAPDGAGTLRTARGIEIGHIFQLGRKYADALDLQVLDRNGKQVTVTMGSYGVGVSRLVAAIAEATCDERGLLWPRAVAPFDVQVVAAGKTDEILTVAQRLAQELSDAGVEVLFDDRAASPGVKFTDAELLGVPTICVVGRSLADGTVEIRDRASGTARDVAVDDALGELIAELHGAHPDLID